LSSEKDKTEDQTNATGIKKQTNEQVEPYEPDFDRMMDRFQSEMDNFWGTLPRWRSWMRDFPALPSRQTMMPSVDLEDRGKDFRVTADLPGFGKENIDIEITDTSLVIRARKTQAEEEKNKNYVRRERTAQTFYRRLTLPERVNSDSANANLNNGVLEIILPKREPKETKKLTIT
jgi:HSP20 family protein